MPSLRQRQRRDPEGVFVLIGRRRIRRLLEIVVAFRAGFDPVKTGWCRFDRVVESQSRLARFLVQDGVGDDIRVLPVGNRRALVIRTHHQHAVHPYANRIGVGAPEFDLESRPLRSNRAADAWRTNLDVDGCLSDGFVHVQQSPTVGVVWATGPRRSSRFAQYRFDVPCRHVHRTKKRRRGRYHGGSHRCSPHIRVSVAPYVGWLVRRPLHLRKPRGRKRRLASVPAISAISAAVELIDRIFIDGGWGPIRAQDIVPRRGEVYSRASLRPGGDPVVYIRCADADDVLVRRRITGRPGSLVPRVTCRGNDDYAGPICLCHRRTPDRRVPGAPQTHVYDINAESLARYGRLIFVINAIHYRAHE